MNKRMMGTMNGDDDVDDSDTNNLHGGHVSLPPGELLVGRSHG